MDIIEMFMSPDIPYKGVAVDGPSAREVLESDYHVLRVIVNKSPKITPDYEFCRTRTELNAGYIEYYAFRINVSNEVLTLWSVRKDADPVYLIGCLIALSIKTKEPKQ